MFRRDFLKAFGAAAAALVGGASLPKAEAAPPSIPSRKTPTRSWASPSGYSSSDQSMELVRLARQTRCVSISRSHTVGGVAYYTTVHRDERDPFGANLNDEAWAMLDAAKAKPRSVSMSCEADYIDVTWPYDGGRSEKWKPFPVVKVIEIEWVGLA
jgi:hypothetical protein